MSEPIVTDEGIVRCPKCHGRLVRIAPWKTATWFHMLTGAEDCPTESADPHLRDTLIDCITSFEVHGDVAAQIADLILSDLSGLTVSVSR